MALIERVRTPLIPAVLVATLALAPPAWLGWAAEVGAVHRLVEDYVPSQNLMLMCGGFSSHTRMDHVMSFIFDERGTN